MKINHLFAALAIAGLFASCQEKPEPQPQPTPDPTEDTDCGELYLEQSTGTPIEMTTEVGGSSITLAATAYVEKAAKTDINVEIEVKAANVAAYNEKNPGATLEALPEDAYSIKTAAVKISKGAFHADDAAVEVDPSKLEAGKTYLVPISIKSSSYEKVSATRNVALYAVVVAEAVVPVEPEVTSTLVCELGSGAANGEIFCIDGGHFVLKDPSRDDNLFFYRLGADGKYSEDADRGPFGWGWGSLYDLMFISPNTVAFRLGDTLQEFGTNGTIDDSANFSWGPGAFIGTAGWEALSKVFNFKDKTFLVVNGDALRRYDIVFCDPYEPNHWVIIDPNQAGGLDVSTEGWSGFKHYLCCGNNILTVTNDGKMAAWAFSDSMELGSKTEIEGDFNYAIIAARDTDNHLLCVAEDGNLYDVKVKSLAE